MGRIPTFDECIARFRQRRGQRSLSRPLCLDRHTGKTNGKNFAKEGSNSVGDRSRPDWRTAGVRTRNEWSKCFFARNHPSSADIDARLLLRIRLKAPAGASECVRRAADNSIIMARPPRQRRRSIAYLAACRNTSALSPNDSKAEIAVPTSSSARCDAP